MTSADVAAHLGPAVLELMGRRRSGEQGG
jgi:hypothetical protein